MSQKTCHETRDKPQQQEAANGSFPRVLFAVFQTSNGANGGVESISQIIDRFPESSCVVTQMKTEVNSRWLRSGKEVNVLELPYEIGQGFWRSSILAKLRRLGSYVSTNWRTLRLLRQNRIEVLHCNDAAPFWHVVPAAVVCRVPVVLNLRGAKRGRGRAASWKYRLMFLFISRLLVLSREMADSYRELVGERFLRVAGPEIVVIYSIVDQQKMFRLSETSRSSLRSDLGIDQDELAIGYIATVNERKNQFDFIEHGCGPLLEQCPTSKVYFVGDFVPDENPYAEACRDLAEVKGISERISFEGYTAEVERWYQGLDLVVVLSRQEGLARCMIESLACETAVVSFDVCSAHEILTEYECGLVVPQGDYPALVEAIVELLNDPGKRARLARNGSEVAKARFSHQEILDCYRNLYASLAQ